MSPEHTESNLDHSLVENGTRAPANVKLQGRLRGSLNETNWIVGGPERGYLSEEFPNIAPWVGAFSGVSEKILAGTCR